MLLLCPLFLGSIDDFFCQAKLLIFTPFFLVAQLSLSLGKPFKFCSYCSDSPIAPKLLLVNAPRIYLREAVSEDPIYLSSGRHPICISCLLLFNNCCRTWHLKHSDLAVALSQEPGSAGRWLWWLSHHLKARLGWGLCFYAAPPMAVGRRCQSLAMWLPRAA